MTGEEPQIRLPERKGLQTLTAQLGIIGAGFVGLFDQSLYLLIPCVLMMVSGEAVRLSFRAGRMIPFGLLPGLLLNSVIFAFFTYGLGRGFGWVARYFNWL